MPTSTIFLNTILEILGSKVTQENKIDLMQSQPKSKVFLKNIQYSLMKNNMEALTFFTKAFSSML